MSTLSDILNLAHARGKELGLPYQGALQPEEASALMQSSPAAKLVDVRTRAELDWVGRIPGAAEIEWASYPGMQPNSHFLTQLQQIAGNDDVVMFICRSGARSHNAAALATQAGYAHCYNVLAGFEGDKDDADHRGTINGWRRAGLPWRQS
ncbi:MAG: rhodanese-like domain-containing protein [Gallionellaceae bacterium]|jgi:rhodanese-related sulfurtransferase|nr:rhodanese-like domain-containing protein [Gallionellaceae bacterium]